MNIDGEQTYNFTKTSNDDSEVISIPVSTLNKILEMMQLSQSDMLEFMENNKAENTNNAVILVNVVGRISFVIGAVEYYLEQK